MDISFKEQLERQQDTVRESARKNFIVLHVRVLVFNIQNLSRNLILKRINKSIQWSYLQLQIDLMSGENVRMVMNGLQLLMGEQELITPIHQKRQRDIVKSAPDSIN